MNTDRQTTWRFIVLSTALLWSAMVAGHTAVAQDFADTVSLRLEQEQFNDGTKFWLIGSVEPFNAGSMDQMVVLTIVGPDGEIVFDGSVPLDLEGSYRYEFHHQQSLADCPFDLRGSPSVAGLYEVCVSYGTANCHALVPVLPPIGSAIIVAGYGEQILNDLNGQYEDLQKSINSLAEYAYEVLRQSRSLPSDRICLLHPDLTLDCDLDGQPDVDGLPTIENLRVAIENWAHEKSCTEQQDLWPSPVTIYIVSGCADSELFYINQNELIWADELACWLSTLKDTVDRCQMQAGFVVCPLRANIILEFQTSGSFIRDLAMQNPDLTILTSSAESVLQCCRSHIAEAGGMMSFGHQFWNRIMLGDSVGCAWSAARQFIWGQYDDQSPQICADSNDIPNESTDELIVSEQCLESDEIGGFSVCGDVGSIGCDGTFRLVSSCAVGESVSLRVQLSHPAFAQDCQVNVVAFPPSGFVRPNIILELEYSDQLQAYVGTCHDGFTAPGQWELLYVAVDPDGHIAITSHKVYATQICIDVDPPAVSEDCASNYLDLLALIDSRRLDLQNTIDNLTSRFVAEQQLAVSQLNNAIESNISCADAKVQELNAKCDEKLESICSIPITTIQTDSMGRVVISSPSK